MHGFKVTLEILWLAAAVMLFFNTIISGGLILSTNTKEESTAELLSKTKGFILSLLALIVSTINSIYFSLAP